MFTAIHIKESNKNLVIKKSCEILRRGGLVVFPTDTVYGLLVDATNEDAVKKLIQFKNRPIGKAISVFTAELNMLKSVAHVPSSKSELLKHLLPGPFTVILKSKQAVSKLLESEKATLGVRIPIYSLVQELLAAYGKPITATSANLGGRSAHYSIDSFLNELSDSKKKLIDLIIDGGALPRNKPSTVVDLSHGSLRTLRKGDIVFSSESTYLSTSPLQTQKIGQFIIDQLVRQDKQKPVVIILQGNLGSGKTVLTKGIAEYFGIRNIISSTFVVYYEYDIEPRIAKRVTQDVNKFVHVDLYNIEDPEEFSHLGLEEYLIPGNVMVVEWGEKLGSLYEKFRENAKIVFFKIVHKGKTTRKIILKQ